jgi:hypothetical protein
MKGTDKVDIGIKTGIFYDQKSEADENQVHVGNKSDSFASAVSVQETAGAAKGITAVQSSVGPYTYKSAHKSAHEVFRSLINASTCANSKIKAKPDGFYIITPGSFFDLR